MFQSLWIEWVVLLTYSLKTWKWLINYTRNSAWKNGFTVCFWYAHGSPWAYLQFKHTDTDSFSKTVDYSPYLHIHAHMHTSMLNLFILLFLFVFESPLVLLSEYCIQTTVCNIKLYRNSVQWLDYPSQIVGYSSVIQFWWFSRSPWTDFRAKSIGLQVPQIKD